MDSNQVQGHEQSEEIQSIVKSNIQLRNLEIDAFISLQKSTTTQHPYGAHKSFIKDLYDILVYEKLPATEEILSLNKNVEEFIEILEVLSDSFSCDKINKDDCAENVEVINKIQLKIEMIKINNSKSSLCDDKENIEGIVKRYKNLSADNILMKLLFHKYIQTQSYELDKNLFDSLKNFQSENQNFIFRDLCETFEKIVVPNTQKQLSSLVPAVVLTWKSLNDEIKSLIINSYIDFQGYYIKLQELTKGDQKHLPNLNAQQIIDIVQNGFTKVSQMEQLDTQFYLKRTFIPKNRDYIFRKKQDREDFTDNTKNYHDFKKELANNRILILADDFGSGKTTCLKHFARRFKGDDNSLWISYVDVRQSSAVFERIQKVQMWTAEWISDFLSKILKLTGIEVSIFKQKYADNQVILLWDHIDGKSKQILIDFAWNINQLTEVPQIFMTRFKYSDAFTQKFNRTAYKFTPFSTHQIRKMFNKTCDLANFEVDFHKLICLCDSIKLRDSYLNDGLKVLVNSNILMFKLILETIIELKMDLESKVDLYFLFDTIFKKQLQGTNHKLSENEEFSFPKCLQAHALKQLFGIELTISLELVKKYEKVLPSIPTISGIYAIDEIDNSIDFHCAVIPEYFIAKYMADNVFTLDSTAVYYKEPKALVTIVALIISQHSSILKLINNIINKKFKNIDVTKKLNENFSKLCEKAQYLRMIELYYYPHHPVFFKFENGDISIRNDFDIWERVSRNIPYENQNQLYGDFKEETKTDVKKVIKKAKAVRNKPTIKGVTSMKKFNCNHEINNQYDEFYDSDDNYDGEDF